MTVEQMVGLAQSLEDHLGDPHDPSNEFSFAAVLDFDEREQYPYPLVQLVHQWGLHEYCLPQRWGGKAGDVEVAFNLTRLVSRRCLTVATTLMLTDVAFLPLWIAGTDEQRRRYIQRINSGAAFAWGLSERHHGSDVLSNETRAVKVPGGYLLTGEKYPIGNATIAEVITVRPAPVSGPARGIGRSSRSIDGRRRPAWLPPCRRSGCTVCERRISAEFGWKSCSCRKTAASATRGRASNWCSRVPRWLGT